MQKAVLLFPTKVVSLLCFRVTAILPGYGTMERVITIINGPLLKQVNGMLTVFL